MKIKANKKYYAIYQRGKKSTYKWGAFDRNKEGLEKAREYTKLLEKQNGFSFIIR